MAPQPWPWRTLRGERGRQRGELGGLRLGEDGEAALQAGTASWKGGRGVTPSSLGEGLKPGASPRSPSRTFSSLWPTYMLMSSGPFTLREVMGGRPIRCARTHAVAPSQAAPIRRPPEEGEAALRGYRLGQEGLACPRGPVEQKA